MLDTSIRKETIKFDLRYHMAQDYSDIYKFLLEKYNGEEECPALLLLDSIETTIVQGRYESPAVLVDRKSERLKKEVKRIIRKPAQILDSDRGLETLFAAQIDYRFIYKLYLNICELLQIPAPALFVVNRMPNGHENFSGTAFPNLTQNLVTDIFINGRKESAVIMKALAHELRHAWQHIHHQEWFDNYDHSLAGKKEYWYQEAEYDAEAFAQLFMEQYDVSWEWDDLVSKKLLDSRKKELKEAGLFDNYTALQLSA